MSKLTHFYNRPDAYRMMGLALAYSLLARLVLTFSSANGNVTIFWIPGGLALAALLMWGKRFWPGIFIGALAAGLMVEDPLAVSVFIAAGNTLESLLAVSLLKRIPDFDPALTKFHDFGSMATVSAISSVISALIGPLSLLIGGYLPLETIENHILHWWQADTLGILLGAPFVLIWRQWPADWFKRPRLPATLCFYSLAFFTGQAVFLNWFHDSVGQFAQAYWLFLFVIWGAWQFGRHGALLVIAISAVQALQGAVLGIGAFGTDIAETGLQNFWFYLLILTVAGISLSISINHLRAANISMHESEARFRSLSAIAPVVIYRTDANGKCVFVNRTWQDLTGFSAESAMGEGWAAMLYAEDRERVYREWNQAFASRIVFTSEYRVITAAGKIKDVLGRAIAHHDQNGILQGYVGTLTDITERKQSEEKLLLTNRVFESTLEGIMITNAERKIIDVNKAFTQITGFAREDAIGKNPRLLKSGHHDADFYATMWQTINSTGHWSGELWNRRKDGEVYPEWITISAITNEKGDITNYVGISSDITLLKQHEKQLEHIAHYDALTGIPNRVLLIDRMQQALAQTRREQKLLAVCYLDLDGFKPINDSQGHEAGDAVLIKTAERIGHSLRGGDTVARLGGDEFVILLLGIETAEDCQTSLGRLLQAINQPIAIKGLLVGVTASIGVTLYPQDDEAPDTLLRHADQAMYLAKQSGKNRYHIFDPLQDARIRINRELMSRIEQGLRENEFVLFYQPKVAMADRRAVGGEALIRWRHPQRGLLSPIEFLPVIENSELEIKLGEWVIDQALKQMEAWRRHGFETEISINIAAPHLQSPGFIETLKSKLSPHPGLKNLQLQIEILETAALADIACVSEIMEACMAIGVGFALDDFGTGYSSLAYLRKLPADTLKIDQSFVRDMLTDPGDHAIVKGIIALAETFNRATVAEGVETEAHFQMLREVGCDIGQGYFIARPMPAEEFVQWHRNLSPSH